MSRSRLSALLFVALSSLVSCDSAGESNDLRDFPETKEVDSAPSGTITGRITYDGEAPAMKPFAITANADLCGGAAASNLLAIGTGGGIQGAVVYVETDAHPSATPATRSIRQAGCRYLPHVIAASVGDTIQFVNDDATQHNVRVEEIETGKILVNVAQASQGTVDTWKVPEARAYLVACDYHPWMNGYIVALAPQHSAITDSTGSFTITGVPVGTHRVMFWHNSIDLREKHDTEGRLIGYRFGDPILILLGSVDVNASASKSLDRVVDLVRKTAGEPK